MKITERLYLTADRKKIVKEGDPKAAFLLAAKGQELPDVIARQYGLLKKKKPAVNKQVQKVFNKQKVPAENKRS